MAVPCLTEDVIQLSSVGEAESKWDVEKILETRRRGKGHQVLVKWVDFPEATWEPLKNLLNTEALQAYEEQHGEITNSQHSQPRVDEVTF
jgi:hypothetical protein